MLRLRISNSHRTPNYRRVVQSGRGFNGNSTKVEFVADHDQPKHDESKDEAKPVEPPAPPEEK